MDDFNILELKNYLNEKIYFSYGYDVNPIEEEAYALFIEVKHESKTMPHSSLSDMVGHIKGLKEKTVEELIKFDGKNKAAKMVLKEYEPLLDRFSTFVFNQKEYLVFNNLIIKESFSFYDGADFYWEEPTEEKIRIDQEMKNQNPNFLEWQKNKMSEKTGINNPEVIGQVDSFSRTIYKSLNEILQFIRLNFIEEDKEITASKDPERLSVKQQMLILHYLFTYLQSSTTEIPNIKLSQLLSKVLNRNSETIRGLLTLMSRVEENESDDKIAKTPRNLTAVSEIFTALNIQQLQLLVEKDLNKIKRDK